MRIPVTAADIESGRFSKSSRALRKAWPRGPIGLMQAQNELASFLGYRDLHDLQGNTVAAIPEAASFSRSAIRNAVAWEMWRKREIPPAAAAQIAEKLHLEHLDVDRVTIEARTERTLMDLAGASRNPVMVDEAWQLLEPGWNPKTPDLIDAGVPPFRFAVLASEKVFFWRDMETLLDRLPEDYRATLRGEGRYAGDRDDIAIERHFMRDELLPMACTSLLDAIKGHQVLPEGFRIEWVFNEAGACVGRVISNEALGGIIPRIFGVADDAIFMALGDLLVGRTVSVNEQRVHGGSAANGTPAWTLLFSRGYDLKEDLRLSEGVIRRERLQALPGYIRLVAAGEPLLAGPTFTEAGQTYVRNQAWCAEDDVPTDVMGEGERLGQQEVYLMSQAAVPATAEEFHQHVWAEIREKATRAKALLRAPAGIQGMVQLAAGAISVEDFDAQCSATIDEYLPYRYEGETEDNPSLLEDRAEALRHIAWLGDELKASVPDLARYKSTSLGLVMLFSESEAPGSRHSGLVTPPSSKNADRQEDLAKRAHFVAFFALSAACLAVEGKLPTEQVHDAVMAIVAEGVLAGRLAPTEMPGAWRRMARFHRQLQDQAKFLSMVKSWRAAQDAFADLRGGGQYLATGEAIPREKPMSFAERYFRMNRKHNVVIAKQSLADVEKRGDQDASGA